MQAVVHHGPSTFADMASTAGHSQAVVLPSSGFFPVAPPGTQAPTLPRPEAHTPSFPFSHQDPIHTSRNAASAAQYNKGASSTMIHAFSNF